MVTEARRPPVPLLAYRPSLTAIFGLGLVGIVLIWLFLQLLAEPSDFVEIFLIGITTGAIYALVALGYTLVYGILELINFAHGDVFMLAGMISATVAASWFGLESGQTGIVVWLSVVGTLLIAMTICGALNASI